MSRQYSYQNESKTYTEEMWQGACDITTADCPDLCKNDEDAQCWLMLTCCSGGFVPLAFCVCCIAGRALPPVAALVCTPVTALVDFGICGVKKAGECCCPEKDTGPRYQQMT